MSDILKDYSGRMLEMRQEIDRHLSRFISEKKESAIDPVVGKIVDLIGDFTLSGGKRLRPIFTILGYTLFEKADHRIYRAAISTEISQTYFLIQDDIMDQSSVRRGRPSFHINVNEHMYRGNRDLMRKAESVSIVASDLADSYCHEALISSGFDSDVIVRGDSLLTSIFETTGHGQLIDIYSSDDDSFAIRDIIRVHLWKTARYTIQGPLHLGAILSNTKEKTHKLDHFGFALGLAFQIHDDYLGLFGDEKSLGKSVKSDVNEGKKTLLILKAMENSSEQDRKFIHEAIRSGNVSDPDFARLKKIVETSGSLDYSMNFERKLADNAKKYIRAQPGDADVREFLEWLGDFIINREM